MGQDEPLSHAIVELVADDPTQRTRIEPVLQPWEKNGQPISVGVHQIFTLDDLKVTKQLLELERSERGRGLKAADAAASRSPELNEEIQVLASSPSFEGTLTITHFQCSSSGCAPISSVSHQNRMDLYYQRYRSNARITSSATGWSGFSATASCTLQVAPGYSCAGPDALGVTRLTYTQRYHDYDRLPSPGRFTVIFRASYNGVAGSNTGQTPVTSCSTTSQTCWFQ